MKIQVDDLSGPEIGALLEEHIADMHSVSPPESRHALDLAGLRKPEITFWTLWDDAHLVGCGALKQLDAGHGEVKSMRTSRGYRNRGVASKMLGHIIEEARRRGYGRLSLETGAMEFFEPARKLYRKFGFEACRPFSSYKDDPNSAYFTKVL